MKSAHLARLTGAAAIGLAWLVPAHAEITVTTWAGPYIESQQKAYGATWDNGGNANINWQTYKGGLDTIRKQIESGDVTWDVVDVLPSDARVGCAEGLFAKLNRDVFEPAPDGTPMDQDLTIDVPNDCVVPNVIWSYVVFYDSERFPDARPSTIADFFDLKRFPGKRAIQVWPRGILEMALVADGVAPAEVYDVMSTPAGIDRGFDKLDSIREHTVFWSGYDAPLELVESGEVAMATAFSGRVGTAVLEESADFVELRDGQILEEQWFALVKGAPNGDQAIDFLVHASTTESQARQARYIPYAPMRKSAFDVIREGEPWYHTGERVMSYLPSRPDSPDRAIVVDPDWWTAHRPAIYPRYKEWRTED